MLSLFTICISLSFIFLGQAWSAATTEGLLIYSLDVGLVFDPFELEIGITPMTVKETLKKNEYSTGNCFYIINNLKSSAE